MSEMILTVLALIACWIFFIRHTVPLLEEWLEAITQDETTDRKE